MNNKFEMMKYIFHIFEIYFVKIKKTSDETEPDNVSCPNMGQKNISLSISTDDNLLILDTKCKNEDRLNSEASAVAYDKIKSKTLCQKG